MKATYTILALFAVSLLFTAAMSRIEPKNGNNGEICGVSQEDLFQCKAAVATGSATPPPPTPACCAALQNANLPCFCTFKTNKYLPLLGINATRAMELPAKCDPSITAHCS